MAGKAMKPISHRAVTRPIIELVDPGMDPTTGERIIRSRWLLPELAFCERELPPAKALNGKGKIVVSVQLPTSKPV